VEEFHLGKGPAMATIKDESVGVAEASNANPIVKTNSEPKAVSIRKLFKYSDNLDIFLVVLGGIGGIGTGIMLPLFSIFLGDLYDDFQFATTDDAVNEAGDKYAKIFAWLALASFVAGIFQVAAFTWMSERMTLRIRKLYLNSILKQEISYFDMTVGGELASRIAENTVVIREGIGEKFGTLFQFSAMFLGGYVIGFIYEWRLTLVTLAPAPLLALGGMLMATFMAEATSGGLGAYARAGGIAEECFSMIRVVQSFSIEGRAMKRYTSALGEAEASGIKKSRAQGLGMGFTMGVYFLVYALAFWFGVQLVEKSANDAAEEYPPGWQPYNDSFLEQYCQVDQVITPEVSSMLQCITNNFNENFTLNVPADVCSCFQCNCGCTVAGTDCTTGGTILLVFFAVIIGSFSLGQAAPGVTALLNARAAAAKIYETIDRIPEIDVSSESGQVVTSLAGNFTFEDVTFRYPARPDVVIFRDFNLTIEKNKTIALVGGSGCGKSTVVALLQRFYDPERGRVAFEGTNIRDFNLASFRSNIGLVGQEPVLFATSISKNIAYGAAPGVQPTHEDIEAAAKAANAHDFISELPDGFNTFVGERGSTLSGGQKQRIAIARAIIRDPSLLILDEATSALDSTSERVVQGALDQLLQAKARTTVVIAHRLSTVRNADKIVVLGALEGVLEEGSHDELIAKDGFYSALHAAAQRSEARGGSVNINALLQEDEEIRERFSSNVSAGSKEETERRSSRMEVEESASVRSPSLHEVDVEKGVPQMKADVAEEGPSQTKKEELYTVPMHRIFKYAKGEKVLLLPGLLAAAVNGSAMPVFAILFAEISNVYFFPTQELVQDAANKFSIYFVIFAIVIGIGYVTQFWTFGVVGERMTTRLRTELFEAFLRQEIGYFDLKENSVGALTSKLATDAAVVKASVTDRLGLIVMNAVTMVVGLTIAFIYGWQLSLVLLALLPLIVIGGAMQLLVLGGLAKEDDKALADAGQVLSESIQGIRTVTAFNLRKKIVTLYDSFLVGPSKLGAKKGTTAGFAFGFSQGVLFIVYSVAFFYGSRLISDGVFGFEDLIKVFFAVVMMGFGIGQSVAMAPDVAKASVGISNVFRVIDRESKIDASNKGGIREEGVLSNDIVFKDVVFTYPSRPEVQIYNQMNLTIEGGKTVALVGSSGSGKSTAIALAERFYDPDSGSVLVRGVDLKDADLSWLRHQIGYVQQEGQLFDTTIFENIAYGVPPAEGRENDPVAQEMVEEAAKKANAHSFISEFPDGYQTKVGAAGSQLSGGQRQRVCLARCLIRSPKILLLDEATSALDNDSQRVVQDALDQMIQDLKATTIIIAHRLTTIMDCDKIVVFSHGVPVESGTHSELLEKNGAYTALWKAQENKD